MPSTLWETIHTDYTTAMKARDHTKVGALRMLITALKNEKIAQQKDLDDAAVEQIIAREVKKRREAMDAFAKGGRAEKSEQEHAEMDVLQAYLPEQMTAEQVAGVVATIIATEKPAGPQDFGKIMGIVMQKLKGKADGRVVQDAVKKALIAPGG